MSSTSWRRAVALQLRDDRGALGERTGMQSPTQRGRDRHVVGVSLHEFAFERLAAPPRRDVRQNEILTQHALRECRHEAHQRGFLGESRAKRIGKHDIARANSLDQPWDAQS